MAASNENGNYVAASFS